MIILCQSLFFIYMLSLLDIQTISACNDQNEVLFLPPFNSMKVVKVRPGDDLTIICCHRDGANYLKWFDNENKLIKSDSSRSIFSLKDEKGRLILKITKMKESEFGSYICENNGQSKSKSISILKRTTYPSPKIEKKQLYFPTNKPIKVNCPLSKDKIFKSWTYSKGGRDIPLTRAGKYNNIEVSKNLTQILITSDRKSVKSIWCHVNEFKPTGDIQPIIYQFIWTLYEPMDVKIKLASKTPILVGHDVKIICTFKPYASLSVQILPRNPMVHVDSSKQSSGQVTLNIKKVTKDLENTYKCIVTKFLSYRPFKSVEESAKLNLEVVVPPEILSEKFIPSSVMEKSKAELKCKVKAINLLKDDIFFEKFDKLSNTWVKLTQGSPGYELKLERIPGLYILNLIFKAVEWNDRGRYKCVVKNTAGETSKEGKLVVDKTPVLVIANSTIYMAMKPVRVDCKVEGFPVYNSRDIISLRLLSQVEGIFIKEVNRKYDDLEGKTVTYEISHKNKVPEGTSFLFECFYKNIKDKVEQRKKITLQIANQPAPPRASIECAGASGVSIRLDMATLKNKNDAVLRAIVYYAPINKFDELSDIPRKLFPISEANRTRGKVFLVLDKLLPDMVYKFRVEVQNVFLMVNSVELTGKTMSLAAPPTPKKLKFFPTRNLISVNVTLDSNCPYAGVDGTVEDLLVKMRPQIPDINDESYNWQWVERNFTLDYSTNSLQFSIYIDKPQQNYEIEVSLRSVTGSSKFQKGIYVASSVLAASVFKCFPRCLACNLSPSYFYQILFCAIVTLITIMK